MSAPLTPADCDLRDFAFMPLDIVRIFGSEFHATANDAEWRAGVTLWLKSFHQVPAGSLPDDDIVLARLAEMGRNLRGWRKVRPVAMRGWRRCDDGRLYHPVVAEKVNDAWDRKMLARERGKKGNEARWGRIRGRLKQEKSETTQDDKPHRDFDGALISGEKHNEINPNSILNRSLNDPCSIPEGSQGTGTVYSVPKGTGETAPELPSAETSPPDWRTQLFRDGVPIVSGLTGKPTASARPLIGKWLKSSRDDCRRVLRVLEDARDANPIDPVAWVEAALRGQQAVASHDPNSWRM
jgi:hypothetical protein